MTALHDLSAVELLARYRERSLSPVEVTRAVLDRIAAWEPHLHATYALDGDAALAAARVSETRWLRHVSAGENVEWAQWLSGAFKGNFDLTVIRHVEPLDCDRYADPNYYYGYDSKAYRDLLTAYNTTTDPKGRLKLLGDIQRQLASDSVAAYLFQLPQFAVGKKQLKGLWNSSPIFANDLAALAWQ